MIAVAVTLVSALMFYLSQGMADLWWLAWFVPAPVLWLAYGNASKTRSISQGAVRSVLETASNSSTAA